MIVGGDAAGMSAATRIRALQPETEIVVLEMSRFTSYSACGIPFVVGGLVAGGVEALVARSPDEHRRRGIDVRTHHEATAIDVDAGEVEFLDQHAGTFGRIGYDQLMIATGGAPVRPDLPGIDLPFIHGVQTLDDAQALLALASGSCRQVVIVGGGYIGLEMAEAYVERGCTATVVEKAMQPLGVVDVDFGARVAEAMRSHGIDVRCGVAVDGFEPGSVLTSDGPIDADLVVLGIGVRARSELAEAAGIELAAGGAVRVDDRQATSAAGVWSAGDCATSTHLLTGQPVHIALGTYANKHGRVAGINMAGGDARAAPSPGNGGHQALLAGGRPDRAARDPSARGRLRCRRHDRRHDDGRRLPAARGDDDRARGRRTRHRSIARRADRGWARCGQADRHRGHGDHRRHDGRRRRRPRPRLCATVLIGLGSRWPSPPGRRSRHV